MNTNLAAAAAALNKSAEPPKQKHQAQNIGTAKQTSQPINLAEQQQAWGDWRNMDRLKRKALSTFAFAVKTKRKRQGLTQRGLAKRAAISQTTVSRAEQGYGEISLQTAISLINALGQNCTLSDNN